VASHLYRTTRPLYLQVWQCLQQLGAATIGSPTTAGCAAHADTRDTRAARRCHDALNRCCG
jgi:hypothetical protein